MKIFLHAVVISLIILMGSCGSDGKKSNPVAEPFIDPLIFGINMEWENLGYYSFTGGELLRDRSFRMNHTVFYDLFGTAKSPLWEPYINGGSVTFPATGGADPIGAPSYPGYAVISSLPTGIPESRNGFWIEFLPANRSSSASRPTEWVSPRRLRCICLMWLIPVCR